MLGRQDNENIWLLSSHEDLGFEAFFERVKQGPAIRSALAADKG